MQFDVNSRVMARLFIYLDSPRYLQAYPNVLLDYTYEAKKCGMHLLDMHGVDECQ